MKATLPIMMFALGVAACGGESAAGETETPVHAATAGDTASAPAASPDEAPLPGEGADPHASPSGESCYVERVGDLEGCWATAEEACAAAECVDACACTEASSRNTCSC